MTYGISEIKSVLTACAQKVSSRKEQLEQIDSMTGDGDLGISMYKGSAAVVSAAELYDGNDLGQFFMRCAMEMNKAAPSTMGTLICAGFMQLGKTFARKDCMEEKDLFAIPGLFAQAIMNRGKAKEGDRTILDALLPLCREFERVAAEGGSIGQALEAGAEAAEKGMEKTKDMVPKIGRAKWNPDNASGVIDGGAMLCSIVASHFAGK